MCVIIIVAVAVAVVVVVSVVSVVAAVDANVVVVVAGDSKFPKSVDLFTTAFLLSLSLLIFTPQKHLHAVG